MELRKKYKQGNLPIIIVYTQNNDIKLFQKMEIYIKESLKNNADTEISEKEEDINLVGVLAKKKENIINGDLQNLLDWINY